jgi:soluble lytic murein transglycosylase-like protein
VPDKRRLTVAMATLGLGLGAAATAFGTVGDAPGHERAGERLHHAVNDYRAGRDRVAKAREGTEAKPAHAEAEDYALVGGVSQETLDAIAACESGGDPTAVNGAGYYGKYQFDLGTWQSVGGTGSPAEAPEAEQDMRASMLYARAGSSPWPNCG